MTIKPWPKVRGLKDYEWKRDPDEDIQNPERRRFVPAVFARIEIDVPVFSYIPPETTIGLHYDEAVFQEENGIKEFYVARRLVKQFHVGDHVVLDVAGCCTILFPPKLVRERT